MIHAVWLSYRDVEELLVERGVEVDHVTVFRWVQRFTPLLVDAARPCRHAGPGCSMSCTTYRPVHARFPGRVFEEVPPLKLDQVSPCAASLVTHVTYRAIRCLVARYNGVRLPPIAAYDLRCDVFMRGDQDRTRRSRPTKAGTTPNRKVDCRALRPSFGRRQIPTGSVSQQPRLIAAPRMKIPW